MASAVLTALLCLALQAVCQDAGPGGGPAPLLRAAGPVEPGTEPQRRRIAAGRFIGGRGPFNTVTTACGVCD